MITGNKIWRLSLIKVSVRSNPTADSGNIKSIQSGVINIPTMLEILALKIAAGRLPPAILTMTTEEETVEGKAAK